MYTNMRLGLPSNPIILSFLFVYYALNSLFKIWTWSFVWDKSDFGVLLGYSLEIELPLIISQF